MKSYERSQTTLLIETQLLLVTKLNKGVLAPGTYTELAKVFGVSRQRIEQIANRINLIKSRSQEGKKILYEKKCLHCGVTFYSNKRGVVYHSSECRNEDRDTRYFMYVPCEQCKKSKKIYKRHFIKNKQYFCNHTCFGKYMGKRFGFGGPEKERNSYVPNSNEEIIKIIKKNPFTAQEFQFTFGYTNAGGWTKLNNLIAKKRVKRIGRGVYELIME